MKAGAHVCLIKRGKKVKPGPKRLPSFTPEEKRNNHVRFRDDTTAQ